MGIHCLGQSNRLCKWHRRKPSMSLMNGQVFFMVEMGLMLSFFPFLLSLIVLHLLMPKTVLDRYWKEPYFRPFELMLFSGWSFFAHMRTLMFMWTFVFPRLGKKRRIVDAHRLVPRWYRIASVILCVWAVVALTGILGITLGFAVYFYAIDDPRIGWDTHLAIAITIGCFGFIAIRQWWLNRRGNNAKHTRSQHRKKNKPA